VERSADPPARNGGLEAGPNPGRSRWYTARTAPGTTFIFNQLPGEGQRRNGKTRSANAPSVSWAGPEQLGRKRAKRRPSPLFVQRIKGRGSATIEYALRQAEQDDLQRCCKNRERGNFRPRPTTRSFQSRGPPAADWKKCPGASTRSSTERAGQKQLAHQPGANFQILMHKMQADPAKAKEVLKFFEWAYQGTATRWPLELDLQFP